MVDSEHDYGVFPDGVADVVVKAKSFGVSPVWGANV